MACSLTPRGEAVNFGAPGAPGEPGRAPDFPPDFPPDFRPDFPRFFLGIPGSADYLE